MASASDIEAGRAFVRLYINPTQFNSALRGAQNTLVKFGQSLRSLGRQMAAWGAGAFTAMFAAGKTAGAYADEIVRAARITSFSAETLQQLKYASNQAGVSFEELTTGAFRMSQFLGSLSEWNKANVMTFMQLGISMSDVKRMRPEDQFFLIANRIMRLGTVAEENRIGMEAMGRNWKNVLPLLKMGNAAFQELTAEAKRTGQVLSDQDLYASRAFAMQLRELWASVKGTSMALGSELLPLLSGTAKSLTEGIQAARGWIREHGAMVRNILIGVGAFTAAGIATWAFGKAMAYMAWGLKGVRSAATGLGAILSVALTPLRWLLSGIGGAARFGVGIAKGLFFPPATIDAYLVRPFRRAAAVVSSSVLGMALWPVKFGLSVVKALFFLPKTLDDYLVKPFWKAVGFIKHVFVDSVIGMTFRALRGLGSLAETIGGLFIGAFNAAFPLVMRLTGASIRLGLSLMEAAVSTGNAFLATLSALAPVLGPVAIIGGAIATVVGLFLGATAVIRTAWNDTAQIVGGGANAIRAGLVGLARAAQLGFWGLVETFRTVGSVFIRDIPLLLDAFSGIGRYFGGWGDMFTGLWASVVARVKPIFATLKTAMGGIQDAISVGEWRRAGQMLVLTFRIAWLDIKSVFAENWGAITKVLSSSGAGIWKSFLIGIDWARMEMANLWDSLKTGFRSTWADTLETMQFAWGKIGVNLLKIMGGMIDTLKDVVSVAMIVMPEAVAGLAPLEHHLLKDLGKAENAIGGFNSALVDVGANAKAIASGLPGRPKSKVEQEREALRQRRHAGEQAALAGRIESRRRGFAFQSAGGVERLADQIYALFHSGRASLGEAIQRALLPMGIAKSQIGIIQGKATANVAAGMGSREAIKGSLFSTLGGGWNSQAQSMMETIRGKLAGLKPGADAEKRKQLEAQLQHLVDLTDAQRRAKTAADLAKGAIAPGGIPGPDELKQMQMRQVGGFSAAVGRSVGALGPMQQVARNTTEANRHLRAMVAAFKRGPDGLRERAMRRSAQSDAVLGN